MHIIKYLSIVAVSFSVPAFGAEKNNDGFQAARQYTNDILGDKTSSGGKVVSTIQVAEYTYVNFTNGNDSQWLATSKVDVKKGDLVSFDDAQVMHKFHSKSLKRTFDEIYFVTNLSVKSAAN